MTRFRSAYRKLSTLASVYYAYMLEYRAEIILWMLSGLLPFVMMGVWIQAGQSGKTALSSLDFARYFLCAFLVRQFTNVWVVWEVELDIVQGRLSSQLMLPIDPIWRHLMMHMGERCTRLPFIAALVIFFFVLYPSAFWIPTWSSLTLAIPAITLAFALRFLMSHTFGLLAFWTERASAIEQLWYALALFLSGIVAPLEMYPQVVREFTLLTPFPYMLYFPAQILAGRPVEVAAGFLVMSLWLAVFAGLNRLLWRFGLRRYSAMGA